jgi:tRNA A37 threonylcarbamoyladenosine synthetase subunit TsaC/SUA5/YrdC
VSYYSLTFETAVDRQQEPVPMLAVSPDDAPAPRRAVEILRAGGLIVFPTEDGYLAGCSALDARAIGRLCRITGAAAAQLMRFAVTAEQERRLNGPVRPLTHPVPTALMRAADLPVVATAVPPGAPPAPTAQHIVFILGDGVDLVLNAGRTRQRSDVVGR